MREKSFILTLLLILFLGLQPKEVVASSKRAITGVTELSARLDGDLDAAELFAIANEVGPFIDQIRKANPSPNSLKKMKALLNEMRQKTSGKVAEIEASMGESEGQLERLYRSQEWDDMSFALAAFPYWRAWIDLELAYREQNVGIMGAEKTTALLPAEKGFRGASLQFYRPGLVYGGWLGLGYVELAKGRFDRARQIFESLENALEDDESPILEVVQAELELLDARSGKVSKITELGKLDDEKARIIRLEAFGLLKESRASGGRPLEAAKRLNALIKGGYLDQSLVNDMMIYAQEISGVKVGYYTDLAGAEFALNNGHFYNAMQKYQYFFSNIIAPRKVDFSNYRYRWALSAYKAKIYQPAIDILEKLQRKKSLNPELDVASVKLLYAVYSAKEDSGSGSAQNRKKLRIAAKRFVRKSPTDPDADSARLLIAQTTSNAKSALKSLNQISSKKLKSDVGRTAFTIIAKEFSRHVRRSKISKAKALANEGIAAFKDLPKADKSDPFYFSVVLQMRALVDPKPEDVLTAISQIEAKEPQNLDIRRALVWSRLQIYDRLGGGNVENYIRKLASSPIPGWQMEFLYPFVANMSNPEIRQSLAKLLHPSAKSQPDMDKRIWSTVIDSMLASDQNESAYSESIKFTKDYPSSGDAWRLLGRSAEKVDKPFEADKAWGVITKKAIPTQEVWWEGMISKARIRSTRRLDQACNLMRKMKRSEEYLPKKLKNDYGKLITNLDCSVESS